MTIAAGSRLGPYEILAPLGAGGMGEVYRARDTRLEREVAVKVLPRHLSSSEEMRQRFEREAKAISQLSHPHICALYDVGSHEGTEYLVMEYLEGETLAARLAKGPLPPDQVLKHGTEIADALDKAHRQGIVHRDLKPGNVMLTKSGVKLLDFGLAKFAAPTTPTSGLSVLPTQARNLTQEGSILGTFQYMAPEQLEGKEADARTDIFAFGCVLHEMATGKKAFSGTTQASLISAILRDEPQPISQVQPMSPAALDRIVKKCLAKDPEDRWQNAADLASELKWIAEGLSQTGLPTPVITRRRSRERVAWIIAAILLVALAAALLHPLRKPASPKTIRFSVAPPEKAEFVSFPEADSLALSPNGASLALIAATEGKTSLWVRRLDALAATELKGTAGAVSPFWSPDGRFIGYFARGRLHKIAAGGGPPQTLCESVVGNAATWGSDGTILFTEWGSGLEGIYRVSSEGGTPTQVTSLDRARGESSQAWPVFLPDGKHFLYLSGAFGVEKERRSISVGSLGSRETRPILTGDSKVAYSRGYLFFARDGALLAQPFDARALRVRGDPIPISDDVWFFRATGNAGFSVSENGDVAFLTGRRPSRLTWRDRTGREIGVAAAPAAFGRLRLAPDGSRIAVQVADPRKGTRDIWIYDAERGLAQRLTEDPVDAVAPVWSPGGDRIAFGSGRGGPVDIYVKLANGAGNEQLLLLEKGVQFPSDWSPDGSRIVYEDYSPGRSPQRQLWLLPLVGRRDRAPLLSTSFSTSQARYSPDGAWIAFVSEESGRQEVYVVPATGQGALRRVSASGGSLPRWKGDGRELLYLADNGDLVSVATQLTAELRVGSASVLFTANPPPRDFDVSRDGRRFLFLEGGQGDIPRSVDLTVVANWAAELVTR